MWARGGPSDTLSSAGVVVRLFDYSSDKDQPWLNCDKASCSYGDRLTGTIINARLPDVYDLWDSWNYGGKHRAGAVRSEVMVRFGEQPRGSLGDHPTPRRIPLT